MGKEPLAMKVFDDYLLRYPDSDITADVIFWFAQYYYNEGQYGMAKSALKRVIDGFPKSALVDDADYLLGWTLFREGNLDEASRQFEKIMDDYPNSDSAYNAAIALGDILIEANRFEEAVKLLEGLLEKYQDEQFRRMINKKIGIIYQSKAYYEKAITYFTKAITADDNDFNAELQFKVAECLEENTKFNDAITEYLKVEYLYPKAGYWSTRANLRAAQIYEAQEKWQDAKKIYEKIADKDIQESKYAQERLNWMEKHREDLK
jgi:TolA-binding protein